MKMTLQIWIWIKLKRSWEKRLKNSLKSVRNKKGIGKLRKRRKERNEENKSKDFKKFFKDKFKMEKLYPIK